VKIGIRNDIREIGAAWSGGGKEKL